MALIDAAAIPADAPRWEGPAFGASPVSLDGVVRVEQLAREDGFARGHAEGLAQGQADVRRLVARLESLVDAFVKPLAGLDAEIEGALARLATDIAGTLLRQAYVADPALLAALVRECIAGVGETTRRVDVRLHGDDVAMLRPLLADVSLITTDVTLTRGDVRVHADTVRIDARLATRLAAVADALAEHPA